MGPINLTILGVSTCSIVLLLLPLIWIRRKINRQAQGPFLDRKPNNRWLYAILAVSSFLLLPSVLYFQEEILQVKTCTISLLAALGGIKVLEKLKIFKIPFFGSLLTAILTAALIGAVLWGGLYLLIFQPLIWHQLITKPKP